MLQSPGNVNEVLNLADCASPYGPSFQASPARLYVPVTSVAKPCRPLLMASTLCTGYFPLRQFIPLSSRQQNEVVDEHPRCLTLLFSTARSDRLWHPHGRRSQPQEGRHEASRCPRLRDCCRGESRSPVYAPARQLKPANAKPIYHMYRPPSTRSRMRLSSTFLRRSLQMPLSRPSKPRLA